MLTAKRYGLSPRFLLSPFSYLRAGNLVAVHSVQAVASNETDHDVQMFCKKDLPEKCRVITPGMMVTRDMDPDRLNVHLNEDGTVSHVLHG